ncbi:MAG: type III polyketide synthase [Phycisphaerales bacterium]|nr:type III polyketide synthase [Phycisphaerales bacterium]
MNRTALIGIGTAVPEHTLQQADAAAHAAMFNLKPNNDRVVRALYRRAGVKTRSSVLADHEGRLAFYNPEHQLPSTAQRMRVYEQHAGALAERACREAFHRADTSPGQITHLITVSCTGFAAPGVDLELIRELGLSTATRRTHIGFMGCHAAVNALAVAQAFAGCDTHARVLICCVELCSLHFDHEADAQGHVANALFADGAAAAIIAASDTDPICLKQTGSIVLPHSADMMSWHIGDQGFRMRLSPRVPAVLAENVPPWLHDLLAQSGRSVSDIGSWAVHPGGPRMLGALSDALGLDPGMVAVSRTVLAQNGNMSSATLLFIIQQLLDDKPPMPLLAAAFGPGLSGEAILLTEGLS